MSATLRQYAAPHVLDGRFWRLLGLSLLVHAGLFVGIGWQRKTLPDPLPPLMATLRLVTVSPVVPEPGVAAARAVPPVAPLPPKARQQEAAVVPRSAPRVMQPAGPANVPAQTSPAAAAPMAETAPAPAAQPVAETGRGETSVRQQGDLLAAYRQRLAELFARGIEYPRIAALRGWEGEVRLRLKVARRGNLLGVALDRSSGFDVLDQHALALLAGYGDLPPLPEALEAGEIQVIVPIQYKLRKTT